MEIEIVEEQKRTELLEVKRGNDLVEAEFAGKAKGHEFEEFVKGIDPKLSAQQKISIWKKQMELEQAAQVYSKMGTCVCLCVSLPFACAFSCHTDTNTHLPLPLQLPLPLPLFPQAS